MPQQSRAEREQCEHNQCRREACKLRLAAGLGDDARSRRAGIDRKRAEQAGQHAARARAEEIAIDIGGLVGIGREGSRGGRGLHHHHDR